MLVHRRIKVGIAFLVLAIVAVLTPRPSQSAGPIYTSPLQRFGAGFKPDHGEITDYDVGALHLGWYSDWKTRRDPLRPNGIEYAQLVYVENGVIGAALHSLTEYAAANPGSLWMVGNEPESDLQGRNTPLQYAQAYRSVYTAIKSGDSTAKVAVGGVVQPTPLRLMWLDQVLAHYQQLYGSPMPVDVWNIHAYILQEVQGSWGAGIPVGIDATEGMLYDLQQNDSIAVFRQQIVNFRTWMKQRGQQNKPLVISEYGVLMPPEHGFTPERVNEFMWNSFDYLLGAKDSSLGYAADEYRLVQRWMWYSINDMPYDWTTGAGFNGQLFDYRYPSYPGVMTLMGLNFKTYTDALAAGLPVPTRTPTPTATSTPTSTPTTTPAPTAVEPGSLAYRILQNGSEGYSGAEDTFIYQYAPTTNYAEGDQLKVGNKQLYAAWLRFDLSVLPPNSTVVYAGVDVYASGWSGASATLSAYRVLRGVDCSEVTWNLAAAGNPWAAAGANNPYTDRGGVAESSVTAPSVFRWYTFDVTALAQEWMQGSLANQGLLLRGGSSTSSAMFYLASANHGNPTVRPRLVIAYVNGEASPTPPAGATATPPPTPTATRTATPSATSTSQPSATPTRTSEPPTPTPTRTATVPAAPSPTLTSTSTASPTPSAQPTSTPTSSPPGQPTTLVLQAGLNGFVGAEDTYLYQYAPTTGYSASDQLKVGSKRTYGALVRFDLGAVPADAVVDAASLELYATGWSGANLTLAAFRVLRPTTLSEATWNEASAGAAWAVAGCNGIPDDRSAVPELTITTNSVFRWYSLDVTALAQDWVNGTIANNGLLLRGDSTTSSSAFYFASSQHASSSLRPKLVIDYH